MSTFEVLLLVGRMLFGRSQAEEQVFIAELGQGLSRASLGTLQLSFEMVWGKKQGGLVQHTESHCALSSVGTFHFFSPNFDKFQS